VTDSVRRALPEESRRLAPLLVTAALRVAGFAAALCLTGTVFSLFSALAGARLLVSGALALARVTGKGGAPVETLAAHEEQACAALGAAGFAYQLYSGGGAGFLVQLLLLPASVAEGVASVAVSVLA
jgi:hypothetical protein